MVFFETILVPATFKIDDIDTHTLHRYADFGQILWKCSESMVNSMTFINCMQFILHLSCTSNITITNILKSILSSSMFIIYLKLYVV